VAEPEPQRWAPRQGRPATTGQERNQATAETQACEFFLVRDERVQEARSTAAQKAQIGLLPVTETSASRSIEETESGDATAAAAPRPFAQTAACEAAAAAAAAPLLSSNSVLAAQGAETGGGCAAGPGEGGASGSA